MQKTLDLVNRVTLFDGSFSNFSDHCICDVVGLFPFLTDIASKLKQSHLVVSHDRTVTEAILVNLITNKSPEVGYLRFS